MTPRVLAAIASSLVLVMWLPNFIGGYFFRQPSLLPVDLTVTGVVGFALIGFALLADYGDSHPESGL